MIIDYGGSGTFGEVLRAISDIIDDWTYCIDDKIGDFSKSLHFDVDSGREIVEVTLRNEC